MKREDFDFLARMLKERSGLVLGDNKGYLLENRLMPLARRHGLKDLDELVAATRNGRNEQLERDVVEAMTTNESFFFRDKKPFDQFADMVLPHLLKVRAGAKFFRIWCAACAGGQEPYSLAMILREKAAMLAGWRYEIVATDLSTEMLAKAKAGVYTQFEVQRGLPIQLLVKYFKQDGERWHIDSGLRTMIQFREFNLLGEMRGLGIFDVVFCRNVLIYFDQATKARVLERVRSVTADDGFLYLGGAETVLGITDRFQPIPTERGIYAASAAASVTAPRAANA